MDNKKLRLKSLWQPPKGSTAPEVETLINVFHEELKNRLKTVDAKHEVSPNTTKGERKALHSLQKRTDIVIRPADKGSATVVMDADKYRTEVLRQLNDEKFYKRLDHDPTKNNTDTIRKTVIALRTKGVINEKTAQDLIETKVKTPHFYTLPKIHKDPSNPPGRPIVSSIRAPTERISAFVDLNLKPLVQNLPSYIKDTKDFLRRLQSLPPLPDHALLFTMDVVGLYSNIPHEDGLEALRTMLNQRPTQQPPTDDIIELARLVLTLNAFQFEDTFFLQTHGTAMGTRMAPSYAILAPYPLSERTINTLV